MASYLELLQQRKALEKQITEVKLAEFDSIVKDMKDKILTYGISATDLGFVTKKGKGVSEFKPGRPVPPKYREPNSGATWTGRGKAPKWLAGQNRDAFLIQA